jgi:lipid A disaccharide synthetase
MMKNNHLVIMAGGVGSRFWSMSTPEYPKQFIDVIGCGRTFIQLTFDRFKGVVDPENVWVVTSEKYASIVKEQLPEIPVEIGKTAYYQQAAGTGLAASGTVTVESAIAGLPLAVIYKVSWISIAIAALVVKLYRNSFVMPNIIANKKVYAEFLQHQVKAANLVPAMEAILPGGPDRQKVIEGMQEVRTLLGDDGNARKKASVRAAEAVWKTLPPALEMNK